jgi:hypothetical protein
VKQVAVRTLSVSFVAISIVMLVGCPGGGNGTFTVRIDNVSTNFNVTSVVLTDVTLAIAITENLVNDPVGPGETRSITVAIDDAQGAEGVTALTTRSDIASGVSGTSEGFPGGFGQGEELVVRVSNLDNETSATAIDLLTVSELIVESE